MDRRELTVEWCTECDRRYPHDCICTNERTGVNKKVPAKDRTKTVRVFTEDELRSVWEKLDAGEPQSALDELDALLYPQPVALPTPRAPRNSGGRGERVG